MNNKLRAYFCWDASGDNIGVSVIAHNAKEAKRIGGTHDCFTDSEFIDKRVKWLKEANIEGLPVGEVDDIIDGIKRGIYSFTEDNCPHCKSEYMTMLYLMDDGEVGCSSCGELRLTKQKRGGK